MKTIKSFNIEKFIFGCMLGMVCLYVAGIIFVNFHGGHFYNYDMYADAFVAKLMWEEKTFFPENWCFGNQFYIAATPNVAALLYGLIGNSFYALATASCLMTFFVVLSFLYCFRKTVSHRGILAGLLCIIGGAIVNSGAGSDWSGLQIFYTMASYYAVYLICILLTFGAYLRLYEKRKTHILVVITVLLLNFAVGMNSLRQTLISCIPLVCIEMMAVFCDILKNKEIISVLKRNIKRTAFSIGVLIFNLAGVVLIRILDPVSNPMSVTVVQATLNPKLLVGKFITCVEAFLGITGLESFGKSEIVFGILSLIFFVIVLTALVIMIKNRDKSPLALSVYFCVLSLALVFCAGLFLIEIRNIYLFVWFLLVAVSVAYLVEKTTNKLRVPLLSLILLCSVCSFYYSFNTDVRDIISTENDYEIVAEEIKKAEIKYIFADEFTSRGLIAFADDEFTMNRMFCDGEKESGYPYRPIPYIQSIESFDHIGDDNAVFMIQADRWEQMEKRFSEEYVAELKTKLELVACYDINSHRSSYTIQLYRMKERIIADFEF